MQSKTLKSCLLYTFSLLILVSTGYSQNKQPVPIPPTVPYTEDVAEDMTEVVEVVFTSKEVPSLDFLLPSQDDRTVYEWSRGQEIDREVEPPDPDPNDFMILERVPKPLNLDEIVKKMGYPKIAKDNNIQGKVYLRILIDKEGKYMKHLVVRDPHPILSKAVEAAIPKLRCTPGIQANRPIKTWLTIPFKFYLP